MKSHTISQSGSDRATAYCMSAKIIRHDDRLYVGWLDAPEADGKPARVQVGTLDVSSGDFTHVTMLGEVFDNHCGPALALDTDNRLHAILGAHHGVMRHVWSDQPEAASTWASGYDLGPKDTLPTLVADASGTLHLAHRERDELWQIWYRRKPRDGEWEEARPIAISPIPGYNLFMQSLSIGPTGAIHLTFQFHYGSEDETSSQKGKFAVHLRSDDGGDTWTNEGEPCQLPVTVESIRPFCSRPEGGIHISNHVVDSQDRPWVFCAVPGDGADTLFRRDAAGWTAVDISQTLARFTMGQCSVSLSRSADGLIHLVAGTGPESTGHFFDAAYELFHLVLDEDGNTIKFDQITQSDPSAAHWLPSLENWDWVRADVSCADGPWLLYTTGLNKGGIGGKNTNAIRTAVILSTKPLSAT